MSTVTIDLPDALAADMEADLSRAVALLKAAYGHEEDGESLAYDRTAATESIVGSLDSLAQGERGIPLDEFVRRRRREREAA